VQNWVSFGDEPPPPIEWLMELEQRDRQVGALLREQHYFVTSQPLPPIPADGLEPRWLAEARSVPGYRAMDLQARLDQMKSERAASSTAAAQPAAA
jgi:hypothetical protein